MALVFAGAGCTGAATSDTGVSATYGEAVTLAVGQSVEYADGLSVKLLEISDSRCPEDVQCFWQGELAGSLELSGGSVGAAEEVRIGAVTNPAVAVDGYSVALFGATELNMTVVVSRE